MVNALVIVVEIIFPGVIILLIYNDKHDNNDTRGEHNNDNSRAHNNPRGHNTRGRGHTNSPEGQNCDNSHGVIMTALGS